LSFDLEDSVAHSRKSQAREAVSAMLDRVAQTSAKVLVVRVNPIDTPYFEQDIAAVVRPGLAMINLPKPDSVEAVRAASSAIAAAQRRAHMQLPVGLLLNIETPGALRDAASLAMADARVCGLQLGLGDLFEPLGIHRREQAAIAQAMFTVRMAAAQAGIQAWDSAFADFSDAQTFREEAAMARRFGFAGKSCIHPNQVALANEAFQPSAPDIAHALKVLAAAQNAAINDVGAWVVDGKMVDAPFVERARAIVIAARALGLIPHESATQDKAAT
jgi:citrate lyase subunit beta / citryl-CoA lyase